MEPVSNSLPGLLRCPSQELGKLRADFHGLLILTGEHVGVLRPMELIRLWRKDDFSTPWRFLNFPEISNGASLRADVEHLCEASRTQDALLFTTSEYVLSVVGLHIMRAALAQRSHQPPGPFDLPPERARAYRVYRHTREEVLIQPLRVDASCGIDTGFFDEATARLYDERRIVREQLGNLDLDLGLGAESGAEPSPA